MLVRSINFQNTLSASNLYFAFAFNSQIDQIEFHKSIFVNEIVSTKKSTNKP